MLDEKNMYRKDYENIFESHKVKEQEDYNDGQYKEQGNSSPKKKKSRRKKTHFDNPDLLKINQRNQEI